MAIQIKKRMNESDLFKTRMDILSGAKLKETDRMKSAIKIQDALRSKIGAWQGSKEIRKWRSKETKSNS